VTIDVGTGDGRAVLAAAAAEPATLVLGLDASAAAMAESSRRAARAAARGGLPNARFIVAAAESPPPALRGTADLVTVRFPWGSLLRGCLGADDAVTAGVAALRGASGRLEVTLAPSERDGLDGLPTSLAGVSAAAEQAFQPYGLRILEARAATAAEVAASTWGRRLLRNGASEDRLPMTLRLGRP
jgi:16S rRNA (adenine(1408)-N(1))-methyltransferase